MLLALVNTPAESSKPRDHYKILSVIPGDRAFRPLAEGGCSLVAQ
jgi:branched-chain amino acid transport system substrate-binding protein